MSCYMLSILLDILYNKKNHISNTWNIYTCIESETGTIKNCVVKFGEVYVKRP